MRNVWTLIRREYLERVRSRSFILFTLLMPAIMAAVVLIPTSLERINSGGDRHITIVANDGDLASVVGHELGNPKTQGSAERDRMGPPITYVIQVDTDTSDEERARLEQQVTEGQITGFLLRSR